MSESFLKYVGDAFNDSNKKYKTKNTDKRVEQAEIVTKCPLCGCNEFITIGKFLFNKLIEDWITEYGINPIPKVNYPFLEKRVCINCDLHYYNYHLYDGDWLYEHLNKYNTYYPFFRPPYGMATNAIKKYKIKSLLEIGAGEGYFLERVRNMGISVVASEYNKKAINLLKSKGIETISEDISKIDKKFDAICAFELLEHIFDTDSFMKKVTGLLNKHGKLIIGTPNPDSILKVSRNGPLNLPPHHQFDFSYKTFEYLAHKYGLKIIEYTPSELEYYQYCAYVKKLTGHDLTQPDICGYEITKKKYFGHSHFVIFEKK